MAADRLIGRNAKQLFCCSVVFVDDAADIHRNDGISRRIDNIAQALCLAGRLFLQSGALPHGPLSGSCKNEQCYQCRDHDQQR